MKDIQYFFKHSHIRPHEKSVKNILTLPSHRMLNWDIYSNWTFKYKYCDANWKQLYHENLYTNFLTEG